MGGKLRSQMYATQQVGFTSNHKILKPKLQAKASYFMCFVYHSCNCLRNILNIPLHFGSLKRYIADVSIIFERSQNSVIHKILFKMFG